VSQASGVYSEHVRVVRISYTLSRDTTEKATGELIDTETVTISSEGGRWKRAEGYLAGGLPYRKPGFKRGR